jgi:hypothetical protein
MFHHHHHLHYYMGHSPSEVYNHMQEMFPPFNGMLTFIKCSQESASVPCNELIKQSMVHSNVMLQKVSNVYFNKCVCLQDYISSGT